jgi:hypothetical protein
MTQNLELTRLFFIYQIVLVYRPTDDYQTMSKIH